MPFGQVPPGEPFENIFIHRLGAEYAFTDTLTVQAGYYWQPSPVKETQTHTRYLDTDQHVFSVALEYDWLIRKIFTYPLTIQGYFQYQYLPGRTIQETINGPDNLAYWDIWGYIINVGAMVQFRFR